MAAAIPAGRRQAGVAHRVVLRRRSSLPPRASLPRSPAAGPGSPRKSEAWTILARQHGRPLAARILPAEGDYPAWWADSWGCGAYRSRLGMVSAPVSATSDATSASLRFEFWLATRSTSNAS
jgi:hypothetical protein